MLAVLVPVIGFLFGCAETPARPAAEPPASFVSTSANYLAGEFADRSGDAAAAARFYAAALAREPNNAEILNRAVSAFVQDGQLDRAAALSQHLLDLDPGAQVALLMLAVEDARQRNFDSAAAALGRLNRRGASGVLAPLLLAWAKVGQGQIDDGLALLTPNAQQRALSGLYLLHAGLIDDLAGRTAAASESFQKAATQSDQMSLRLVAAIGRFFERQGRAKDAEALYAQFNEQAADSIFLEADIARLKAGVKPPALVSSVEEGMAEALFDLASALQGDRQSDLALIYARLATRLKPDFAGAAVLIGDLLERQGRLQEANVAYQAISGDPIYGWAARLRIAGNLEALGETDRAVQLLKQMSAERPERIDALIRLGDLHRAKNQFAEAVVAYDDAVRRLGAKTQSFQWGIFYSRGVALERSGQWQRAEADFLKALELSPDQPIVLNYLGYGWADQGVHLDRALGMISRAVELRPQDGYIVDSKGWVLYRLGDYPGAVGQLERAVELRPLDPVINDHLGDAYWKVGRRAEARFQWQRALSLEPEATLTTTLRAKLERGLAATGG